MPSIDHQVSYQVRDQCWHHVDIQASKQVCYQVIDQVTDQVYDQVRSQLWNQFAFEEKL